MGFLKPLSYPLPPLNVRSVISSGSGNMWHYDYFIDSWLIIYQVTNPFIISAKACALESIVTGVLWFRCRLNVVNLPNSLMDIRDFAWSMKKGLLTRLNAKKHTNFCEHLRFADVTQGHLSDSFIRYAKRY